MMVPIAFILALLAHSCLSFTGEELYHPGDLTDSYLYQQEDYPEEPDLDLRRRDANFLRFGRGGGALVRPESEYEDYSEDFARPTRAGEKSDHFIRFGRSKQDYHLRFGKRDKSSNYLRFGRSISATSLGHDNDDDNNNRNKKRNKRDTFSAGFDNEKRGSADYLRFGRNSNFLRFGRNHPHYGQGTVATTIPNGNNYHQNNNNDMEGDNKDSPLVQLLTQLLSNIKKEPCKCGADA